MLRAMTYSCLPTFQRPFQSVEVCNGPFSSVFEQADVFSVSPSPSICFIRGLGDSGGGRVPPSKRKGSQSEPKAPKQDRSKRIFPLILGAAILLGGVDSHQSPEPSSINTSQTSSLSADASHEDPWALQSRGDRTVRVDLAGDPQVGEILFINQMHGMDIPREGGMAGLRSDPELFYNLIRTVGEYQFNILKLLERLRPSDIFVEGLSRDFTQDEIVQDLQTRRPRDLEMIRTHLMGNLPAQPTTAQVSTLFFRDAAHVYALRHPEVTLRRVMTPQEADQIALLIREINPFQTLLGEAAGNVPAEMSESDRDLVFERRETWAAREIRALLSHPDWQAEHPQRRVILFYGMRHGFCDNFMEQNFLPRVTRVWWEIDFNSPHPLLQAIERHVIDLRPEACEL